MTRAEMGQGATSPGGQGSRGRGGMDRVSSESLGEASAAHILVRDFCPDCRGQSPASGRPRSTLLTEGCVLDSSKGGESSSHQLTGRDVGCAVCRPLSLYDVPVWVL